jgi:hypothetical protein
MGGDGQIERKREIVRGRVRTLKGHENGRHAPAFFSPSLTRPSTKVIKPHKMTLQFGLGFYLTSISLPLHCVYRITSFMSSFRKNLMFLKIESRPSDKLLLCQNPLIVIAARVFRFLFSVL